MICPSCGSASSDSARFCGTCGNPLQRTCRSCGAEAGSNQRFCSACGESLETAEPDVEHPAERKLVTVLFAEVVDSTSLVDGLDAEQAIEVLGPLTDAMRSAVNRYDGMVSQVDGDGIMALFGAPLADEHHAIGACFAAVDMPRLVKSIDPEVEIRIGVHTGEVYVHGEGRDPAYDYVASGPTVHLASRMEQAARPGIPMITAATAALATGNVRLGPPHTLEVRGSEASVEVYELLGKGDAGGTLSARMSRRLTEFVARSGELHELRTLLGEVTAGDGVVLSIVGGPGVGKTRLVHEFVHGLEDEVQVLSAHGSPYDLSTPYRPVSEMMRRWLAARGGGPYNTGEVLEALDPSLTTYADAVVALIGGQPSAAWTATDAGLRRQTTRRALRATIGAAAAESTLMLLFEDIHWMDGESLALMDELAALAEDVPLLMVATLRPEGEARWDELSHAHVLELEGLLGSDVARFVEVLIGTRSSTARIRAELTERTDGTPLFLEEMVRALADEGVLVGGPGRYKRGEGDLRMEIPAGVQAVIASRIDRLPMIAKEVLQLLAVHGEHVRADLLEATTDRNDRELSESLRDLQEAEMVFEDGSSHPPTYAFKHDLIREVTYSGIPAHRREDLHARIAEGVIALEFEDDWTERLAHHTFEAAQWEDSARFALASARRAQAKSAYRESERFLKMSLDSLSLLPKRRANTEQTIDALIARRISRVGIGSIVPDSLEGLDEAEALANEIGDLDRVAGVNLHRSYARSLIAHHTQGLLDADRAYGLGQQLGRRRLTAEAHLAQAQHHAYAGRPGPIPELLDRDVRYFRDEVGRNGMLGYRIVYAHAHLAVAHALTGDLEEGREEAQEAVAAARHHGLALDEVNGQWALAQVEVVAEQFEAAAEVTREAVDTAEKHEFVWVGNIVSTIRGYALARMGNFDKGVAMLEKCIDTGRAIDAPMHVAWACAYLSELMTSCGQDAHAINHAQEALGLARRHELPAAEVMALHMLGRAQHRLVDSRGFFEEALSKADATGLAPQASQIRAELGWVVAEMGHRSPGRELVAQANESRVAMGLLPIEIPGLSD